MVAYGGLLGFNNHDEFTGYLFSLTDQFCEPSEDFGYVSPLKGE